MSDFKFNNVKNGVFILNSTNFNAFVNQDYLVMIDFWASWCRPCLMAMPLIEDIAKTYSVGKVNIEEESGLANDYNVNMIPTFIFFYKGQKVKTLVGMPKKEEIEDVFKKDGIILN